MLKAQKHLFDIPEHVTYLNIASQSPLFKSSYEAGIGGLKQKSRPYNIKEADYFEPVDQLKQLFAQLIDCDNPQRVVTIPAVSYGVATIANNITLKAGDEIIVIDEQFPSNYYSWKKLADRYNAKIVTVLYPSDHENPIEAWNTNILERITDKTAVVAMGNIHWSNGRLFNLKTIREKTKLHNALLIIDGSQSVGALPFSVKDIQPDALVCAGYKWLFGPYGCAYAYYGEYFDEGKPIEENWSNRLHSDNFAMLTKYEANYKPYANRYSMGESGSFIYVKMQIAAIQEVLKVTPDDLQNYCHTISEEALHHLSALGFISDSPEQRAKHLFGIKIPKSVDKEILKRKLIADSIYVSFRGDYLRLSCHIYNTEDDFDKLTTIIKSII